ncbi:hypothetical protein ADK55_12395 [Streptomyces sp. WM4235]|uniref:hypothetical protein n=1 Tax=unclassified Streptomyces TaxID=2593676 RepID=UPI0006AE1152|nr:hypothetical protein [Streptomyces sp. WM4235]KOU57270.1 hypothetical protein ADK55_12395 [Streptomyces sp. WM4235]
MAVREQARPDEAFNHVDHPLLHRQVRDRKTDREGTLMAVLRDPVGTVSGRQQYARTAYIRDDSGVEFTAAPGDVEPA